MRLHQDFATGGMVLAVNFAGRQSQPADVRFGSLADIARWLAMSALPPIADIRADEIDVANLQHHATAPQLTRSATHVTPTLGAGW
jgi:hypothetical protein